MSVIKALLYTGMIPLQKQQMLPDDGVILISNRPHHGQQGPQICTNYLRQLSPRTRSLKCTRSNFFKAVSAVFL